MAISFRSLTIITALTAVTMQMNKLLFLDSDTNIEVSIWREEIIINFKHNVPGFIVLAFADAKRE